MICKVTYFLTRKYSGKNNPIRSKSNFFIRRIRQVSSKETIIKSDNRNYRKVKLSVQI